VRAIRQCMCVLQCRMHTPRVHHLASAHNVRLSSYTKACNQRMQAGALVTAWLREMSAYVKQLDPAHMVSSGGVGYRLSAPSVHRTAGAAAADARLESMERRTLVADADRGSLPSQLLPAEGAAGLGAQINWPFKGEDYEANVLIDTLDFATIHSYPGVWSCCQHWPPHTGMCMHVHLLTSCVPPCFKLGVYAHNSMLAHKSCTFLPWPACQTIAVVTSLQPTCTGRRTKL